jgi:hypothetical protein
MRIIATVALSLALLAAASCSKPTPKEQAYPAWNFAASFTGEPKVTDSKANGGQPATLLVVSSAGGHDFSVYAMDTSSASVPADQILANAPQALSTSQEIDEGSVTYVATDGVTGREVLFTKNDKPAIIVRFFVTGGKLYEVNASVPAGASDPDAKAFLDSFHLLTPPPPPAANTAPAANAATNAPG